VAQRIDDVSPGWLTSEAVPDFHRATQRACRSTKIAVL
jgi:hypothetical protein